MAWRNEKTKNFEKLPYDDRNEKFGVIAKVKVDDYSGSEDERTFVFRKEVTPKEEDYRDLMRSGKWAQMHSTYPSSKKWEWGTPSDYLGKGTKLLLFDKTPPGGITVIANVTPKEAFIDRDNYHKVRNVLDPFPDVLEIPISSSLIKEVGLKDPNSLGLVPFEEITESQFNELMRRYNASNRKMISTDTKGVWNPRT